MVLKEIKGETNDPVPPWVQSLQKEYGDVFQDPLPAGVPSGAIGFMGYQQSLGTLHHLDLYTVYLR
jgi:hypothetical protein